MGCWGEGFGVLASTPSDLHVVFGVHSGSLPAAVLFELSMTVAEKRPFG